MIRRYLNISAKVFIAFAIIVGLVANLITIDAKNKIMLLNISFVLFTGALIKMLWLKVRKA